MFQFVLADGIEVQKHLGKVRSGSLHVALAICVPEQPPRMRKLHKIAGNLEARSRQDDEVDTSWACERLTDTSNSLA